MKTVLATVALISSWLAFTPSSASPAFSTGGPCPSDATSRMPSASERVLLSNPSKLYLAATLYRQIDKPNFTYRDADGVQRRSDFPSHYQVFIPPNGKGPIGCTRIFVGGGEAAQTFTLEKTDYFLSEPIDNTEEARRSVGFIAVSGAGTRLINLHATKTVHVTLDRHGASAKLDVAPQAVSAETIETSIVKEAHF